MMLLLLLLPALAATATSPIDWTTCGAVNRCYCLDATSGKLEFHTHDGSTPEKAKKSIEKCKIGMQNKFFNSEMALFQLQVIDDKIDLGPNPQLILYNQHVQPFGCKLNERKVVIESDSVKNKATLEVFEDRSRFEQDIVVCAFTMKGALAFREWMGQAPRSNSQMKMKIISSKPVEYEFKTTISKINEVFDSLELRCNPYDFNLQAADAAYSVKPLKDLDKDTLTCANYGPSYTIRYKVNGEDESHEAKELKCEQQPDGFVLYSLINKTMSTPIDTGDQTTYYIYCAAQFDETCARPSFSCAEGDPNCPSYNVGSYGVAATLTCPHDKWLVDGQYLVLESKAPNVNPVCKQDYDTDSNAAAFYITLPSGKSIKPPSDARCFTEYDCKKNSKLDYSNCAVESPTCGIIDYSGGTMKCQNNNYQLSIHNTVDNTTLTASSCKCNASTGVWTNSDTGANITEHSRIRCFDKDGGVAKPIVDLSQEELYMVIGGIIAGCIAITALIGGVLCFCYHHPHFFTQKGKKSWMRMNHPDRLKYSKDLFGKVTQATKDTSHRIVHGFNLIDLLLETETVDPAIWDEAGQFLMRFQGSIEKLDHNIWHMFSRYMFLQSKKIIDKHTWLSSKPITNKKPMNKGLMRCVAIRMLSLGMYDPMNDDAERLIQTGYRTLQLDAVEQYPHCGMLWTAMCLNRTIANCKNKKTGEKRLDRQKLLPELKSIALQAKIEMPKDDVIPHFGSPAEQAAFALGGSPDLFYHKTTNVIEPDKGEPAAHLRYFAGMGASLSRNPAVPMIVSFNMKKKSSDDVLVKFKQIAPEKEWNDIVEKTMRIVVYYGRSLDAKRLQTRFMPSVQQPSELYTKLKMDQQFFEEAVSSQLEELRKWFAERTDIKELKGAPDYAKDADLDALIYAKLKADKEKLMKEAEAEAKEVDAEEPEAPPEAAAEAAEAPAAADAAADAAAAPAVAATPPVAPAAGAASSPVVPVAAAPKIATQKPKS